MKPSKDDIALLAAESATEFGPHDPPPDEWVEPGPPEQELWFLRLSPKQQEAYDDPTDTILLSGERGSGKSFLGLSKMVRHCYENENAFAVIIAKTIRNLTDGVGLELERVLDIHQNGNIHPDFLTDGTENPLAGQRMDTGMGLEFTQIKSDPLTKDKYLYIRNRWGSACKVLMISIMHSSQVAGRMKSLHPTFEYVEEITELEGAEYFTHASAQLGRVPGFKGPQQYVASCNPDGPSHWVYTTLHVKEAIEQNTTHPLPGFAYHHIPSTMNRGWISKAYIEERIERAYQDEVERDRMLRGLWVDRPSGDSIFKDYFIPTLHIAGGDEKSEEGILPVEGWPMLVGYDPGPRNFSIHMLQYVPAGNEWVWLVIDEMNFVGKTPGYPHVVRLLMLRMDYWETHHGVKTWEHIADEAAFNQRNSNGNFDSQDIERYSQGRIRLRPCPKGKNSVPIRVRMVQELMLREGLIVSPSCPKTIRMLRYLESEKVKPGEYDPDAGFRPKRSIHIHPFDSMSYPIFKLSRMPSGERWLQQKTAPVTQEVFIAGNGTKTLR